MKRPRDEIINDIVNTENFIDGYKGAIKRETTNVMKYTAELDNHDINQHKLDTIGQFEKWKNEFYERYAESPDYDVMMKLLDNYSIMYWKPKCYVTKLHGRMMNIYSNKICISLNTDIFLNFSADRMNYSLSKDEMTIWHIDGDDIDLFNATEEELSKVADMVGLSVDSLLDVSALCYHTFMFNPKCLTDKHSPNFETRWTKIIAEKFSSTRCSNNSAHFYDRRNETNKEKRLKACDHIPQLKFSNLYNIDTHILNYPKVTLESIEPNETVDVEIDMDYMDDLFVPEMYMYDHH